jgi:hypothetical protein
MKYKTDEKGRLTLPKKVERWLFIICISFTLFVILYAYHYRYSVNKYGKITIGVVVDIHRGVKTNNTFDYEYIVNDKKFIGGANLSKMPYKIQIGDTLDIRYDSTCVNRSRPVDVNSSWW